MNEEIFQRVKKVFEQNGVLVYEEDRVQKLEIDSIQFVSTIADLEIEFDIRIPDEVLNDENLNSMYYFCKEIEKLLGESH